MATKGSIALSLTPHTHAHTHAYTSRSWASCPATALSLSICISALSYNLSLNDLSVNLPSLLERGPLRTQPVFDFVLLFHGVPNTQDAI